MPTHFIRGRSAPTAAAGLLLLLFGVGLPLLGPTAAAQETGGPSYTPRHWTTGEGLPVGTIRDLAQGPQGYLWAATYAGLVRFDGREFETMTAADSRLPNNRLRRLQRGPSGDLWIRTAGEQVVRVDPRRQAVVATYGKGAGGIEAPINALTIADSTLWLRTQRMLHRAPRGDVQREAVRWRAVLPDTMNVIAAQSGAGGALWVGTGNRGLWRVQGESAERVAVRAPGGERVESIYAIARREGAAQGDAVRGGAVWVANDRRLFRVEGGRLAALPPEAQVLTGPPLALEATPQGLWVYQGGSVHVIEGGQARKVSGGPVGTETVSYGPEGHRWTTYGGQVRRDGRAVLDTGGAVEQLLRDREGNWWVATRRDGLYRLRRTPITMIGTGDGLPAANVYGVSPARPDSGGVWVGSIGGGLASVRGGEVGPSGVGPAEVEPVTEAWGLPPIVWTALETREGTVWIGTQEGLYVHGPRSSPKASSTPEAPSTISAGQEGVPEALRDLPVRAAYEDRAGRVWFYQYGTVYAWAEGQWQARTARADSRATGRAITQTESGSVWIGSDGGGLVRVRGDTLASAQVRRITTADGLPEGRIRSIHEDRERRLWVGTGGQGLVRLDRQGTLSVEDDSLTSITRADGLPGNTISQILPDGQGRLWMSTNRGIFRVQKAELSAFVEGEAEQVRPVVYTEKDGLSSREANGGVHPAGTRTSDGRLWFPTQEGVAVIDPSVAQDVPPPPAAIDAVAAGDTAYATAPGDTLRLRPEERTFTVRHAGLHFADPAATRFRVRLGGFDQRPTRTDRRQVRYTEVGPGRYTLVVQAAGERGAFGEPARLTVTIAPFWWETWWFLGLCGLGLLGLAVGAYRWRTDRLRRRQEELEQTVAERTEEVREQRDRLEKQRDRLEEQAEKLRALDEAKSRFFANVSHEFRTPLTLIWGPVQRLRDRAGEHLSVEDIEQVEVVERNVARLQRLVDQLLGLARLEAGTYRLSARPVDVAAEARRFADEFGPLADRKGLSLAVETEPSPNGGLPDDADPVYADREALGHVLSNLLSNAVKFTPEGGRVTVRVRRREEAAQIAVEDTGVGIPEGEQEAIFDRFAQTDDSATREQEGAGIGLALARDLVDLHGGTIAVESTEGEGSTFTACLPRGKGSLTDDQLAKGAPNDQPSTPDAQRSAPAPQLSTLPTEEPAPPDSPPSPDDHSTLEDPDSKAVLVVDDNADVRRFVRTILTPKFAVLEAANGREGLRKAREHLPDVILADVMMPSVGGREMTRRLRETSETEAIPVIMVTARASASDEIEGLREGADDYVTKPFDADVLRARIDGQLSLQQRLRRRLEAKLTEATLREEPAEETVPGDPPEEEAAGRPEIERKARAAIRARLTDPDFGVDALAEELAVSRSTLYRKLTGASDTAPSALLTEVRMAEAKRLLASGEPATQVAYAVGYETLAAFSSAFDEHVGTAPSRYAPGPNG